MLGFKAERISVLEPVILLVLLFQKSGFVYLVCIIQSTHWVEIPGYFMSVQRWVLARW